MGKYIDYYCADDNRNLKPIVDNIIKTKFGWLSQKDYDDFYSIAGQVVWDCEKIFDKSKGVKFETLLINCLNRKIKTRITWMNREKRVNDTKNVSLDMYLDENEKNVMSDFVVIQPIDEPSHLIHRYLDLLTPLQKKVANLIMDGRDRHEIKEILNLSEKKYDMVFKRMCDKKKTNVLNLLRGERI